MEFADKLRNELFKANAKELFGHFNVQYLIDAFNRLISSMEKVLLAYNTLQSSSFELKTMIENLVFPENIVDMNLWNRDLKPEFERKNYISSEISIHNVRFLSSISIPLVFKIYIITIEFAIRIERCLKSRNRSVKVF